MILEATLKASRVKGTPLQSLAVRTMQKRTILGISSALDRRLYRMAKGVMPTISQTEQVALGCGTIGKLILLSLAVSMFVQCRLG